LDQVTACFSTGPLKGRTLKLVGHADPRGGSDYNMTLGQSRADSVAGYMLGHGMDRSKTESTSRGAIDATGTDEPTWARDRRVDLMVGQ
jgi:peptidoglycan-associated lipoprotein